MKQKAVLSAINKMNRDFNPFQMESLSDLTRSELRGILNKLEESGYITQQFYINGGFSIKLN